MVPVLNVISLQYFTKLKLFHLQREIYPHFLSRYDISISYLTMSYVVSNTRLMFELRRWQFLNFYNLSK